MQIFENIILSKMVETPSDYNFQRSVKIVFIQDVKAISSQKKPL